jgi:hypothetical protein
MIASMATFETRADTGTFDNVFVWRQTGGRRLPEILVERKGRRLEASWPAFRRKDQPSTGDGNLAPTWTNQGARAGQDIGKKR